MAYDKVYRTGWLKEVPLEDFREILMHCLSERQAGRINEMESKYSLVGNIYTITWRFFKKKIQTW